MVKRYRIDYEGTVQGVGFRYFVLRTAQRLGLTGYVLNLDNGHVEIEIQGPEARISDFLARMQAGNGYSSINKTDIREIAARPEERSFEVRF